MLSKVVGWLGQLKLTIGQWIIASLAVIIGFLLIKLKLQGTALHKAQIALLEQKYYATDHEDEVASMEAYHNLAVAKKAFEEAIK